MNFLRRAFFMALILSGGLLASCVSTDSRQPGNVKYLISDSSSISPETKDRWVALMQNNEDAGVLVEGRAASALVMGKVLNGITRDGERVVLELAGPDQDQGFYRTELTADNAIIDQKQGTWWPSEGLICRNLKAYGGSDLKCYRVLQFETQYVMVDLEGDQQYRFQILKDFNIADVESRFRTDVEADEEEDEEDRPYAYWIGLAVAYSELCNTFAGDGVDPRVLKSVADDYETKEGFDKGYHRLSGARGSDGFSGTGLTHCSNMNNLVLMAYEGLGK